MPDNPLTPNPLLSEDKRYRVIALVGIIFLIILILGIYVIRSIPDHTQVTSALTLSAVVLTGLALVVVLMAGLVLVYFYTYVTNGTQALGLPEGSVRALLAFSLTLIFVALAAYLYSSMMNTSDLTPATQNLRATEAAIAEYKNQFVVISEPALITDQDKKCIAPMDRTLPKPSTTPSNPDNSALTEIKYVDCGPLIGTQAIDATGKPLYKASLYVKRSKDSDDFAKLIFGTLGGVFTSVIAFYFGSSTTASAVAAGVRASGGDPNPKDTGRAPGTPNTNNSNTGASPPQTQDGSRTTNAIKAKPETKSDSSELKIDDAHAETMQDTGVQAEEPYQDAQGYLESQRGYRSS